ncbi:hypothetical protein N7456_011930 [Penicillium angulare]|uniref:Uncharacterized protein n=1 Tax=Penicillium angulare TaxID=116970 RepID=A0A9W9EUT5_9EURO|nr:hypothetical protein N7456_011930 [Penicillium angulare]
MRIKPQRQTVAIGAGYRVNQKENSNVNGKIAKTPVRLLGKQSSCDTLIRNISPHARSIVQMSSVESLLIEKITLTSTFDGFIGIKPPEVLCGGGIMDLARVSYRAGPMPPYTYGLMGVL